MNSLRILFFSMLMFSFTSGATSPTLFSKITYSKQKQADQLLISMHHAVLEVNRKEKFIIATLTEPEKKLLKNKGFIVSFAKNWTNQFAEKFPGYADAGDTDSHYFNTILGFECYATVEETYSQAQALAESFPKLASWQDIGDSWQKANSQGGYDLMVLKITNTDITQTKPILFVHSSMHAREYAPAALNLDFAKWLLNNYQTNAEARWIVNNREIHLLLQMNPDGRKIAENQILQRKNTNQNHCAGSGVGVDLNRNFAQTWAVTPNGSSGNECSDVYRGSAAESEPETQAVSNYIRSLFPDERGPNDSDAAPDNKSGMHIDLHSYGKLILWPYGHREMESPNDNGFVNLGHKLAWFNDYRPQQSIGLYATDGTSDNVSYGELGVAAITFELGSSFFQDCTEYRNKIKPDNLRALIYAAKVSEAPYLLSTGPDISILRLNNNLEKVTVSPAAVIDLDIISNKQSKLARASNNVQQFEYVINGSFSDTNKVVTLQNLTADNGRVNVNAQINTADMAVGQHMISVRAKNTDDQYGVVQSAFITITDSSAPTASFAVACDYLVCDFDAKQSTDSDGNIIRYQWTKLQTDNTTEVIGSGETLQYTFDEAGEVTIQLLVEDNNNLQATTQQSITLEKEVINQLPEASFVASCQNLVCSFDASQSSDSDGSISKYQWQQVGSNASVENIGEGQVLQHTFASAGNVTVKLVVDDNNGAQASTQQSLTVENVEVISVVVETKKKSSGGSLGWFMLFFTSIISTVFRRRTISSNS